MEGIQDTNSGGRGLPRGHKTVGGRAAGLMYFKYKYSSEFVYIYFLFILHQFNVTCNILNILKYVNQNFFISPVQLPVASKGFSPNFLSAVPTTRSRMLSMVNLKNLSKGGNVRREIQENN